MNVDGDASDDVKSLALEQTALLGGAASSETSKSHRTNKMGHGVSTRNVSKECMDRERRTPRWYALRTSYGRERKAYEYIVGKGGTAFYPTVKVVKEVGGRPRAVEVSRIPNVFFAYGTEEEIRKFVFDNVNLSYLRFYYTYFRVGVQKVRRPLVVPDGQIESLRIICAPDAGDVVMVPDSVTKFKAGKMVRIVEGQFAGVVGRVARFQGQQRVAVVIEGLLTVATAYVPSAFLEPV